MEGRVDQMSNHGLLRDELANPCLGGLVGAREAFVLSDVFGPGRDQECLEGRVRVLHLLGLRRPN